MTVEENDAATSWPRTNPAPVLARRYTKDDAFRSPRSAPAYRSLFTTTQLASIKAPKLLGSVPYLNARPLHWTIKDPVKFLDPSALTVELAEGRLQAGLLPIYSVLENTDLYHVVDSYAIGTLNTVYSVVMAHALPIVRLKTVALDPASRTSNHLARVLLEKYYRVRPQYVSSDEPAEGQVMIGDPAIAYRQAHPDERYSTSPSPGTRTPACPSSSPSGPSVATPRCQGPRQDPARRRLRRPRRAQRNRQKPLRAPLPHRKSLLPRRQAAETRHRSLRRRPRRNRMPRQSAGVKLYMKPARISGKS